MVLRVQHTFIFLFLIWGIHTYISDYSIHNSTICCDKTIITLNVCNLQGKLEIIQFSKLSMSGNDTSPKLGIHHTTVHNKSKVEEIKSAMQIHTTLIRM